MHGNTQTICIDRVHPDETEVLLRLYVDLFHGREPLTKCLGLSRERMISVARSMHTGANANPISRGSCWMARDRAAGMREIGFIVCDDPAAEGHQQVPENLADHEREEISALLALMEDIRKPEKDRIGSEPGKCLHISAIGVAPGYEGFGIATSLLQTALADATARGFAHAFSECTSIPSRKCHEKAGFRELHCVAVNEFVINGMHPFASGYFDVCLLWKDLVRSAC